MWTVVGKSSRLRKMGQCVLQQPKPIAAAVL